MISKYTIVHEVIMSVNRSKQAPPLYIQIFNYLLSAIESQEILPGETIPSEKQLGCRFGVSRMTVRLAVNELANRGYVEKKQGIGTLVTYKKIDEELKMVRSFSEEMKQNNIDHTTEFSEIELVNASFHVSEQMKLHRNTPIYRLERIRSANNAPIVHSVSYLNIENLSLDPKDYSDSLYDFLRDKYNILISSALDTFEAILAEAGEAEKLKISIGDPIFKRTRKGFNGNMKLIEYSISYYPGEKYQYSIRI